MNVPPPARSFPSDGAPNRPSARFVFLSDQEPTRLGRDDATSLRLVAWRVLAANNRPLGRSVRPFDSLTECLDSAMLLHERVSEAIPAVNFVADDGHWRWTISLDGYPVAEQVHLYQRRVEANRSVKQFLAAVQATRPSVSQVRMGGRRAMAAYIRRQNVALIAQEGALS